MSRKDRRVARLAVGLLGLLAIPVVILVDEGIAASWGWRAGSSRHWAVPVLSAVTVAATASLLRVLRFREWVGRNSGRIWLVSGSTALAVASLNWIGPVCTGEARFHLRAAGRACGFQPDADLFPGVTGPCMHRINSQGLRGPEWPSPGSAYRILCVGGSTTDCLYLDDSKIWPARLAAELNETTGEKYWTGSAGQNGARMEDHWEFVRDSALVGQVNCVVCLAGADDYLSGVLQMEREGPIRGPFWTRLWLFRELREWQGGYRQPGFAIDFEGKGYREFQSRIPIRTGNVDLAGALDRFERGARRLCANMKTRGKRLILITQPSLWDDAMSPLAKRMLRYGSEDTDHPKKATLRPESAMSAMDEFNQRLANACRDLDVEFLDVAPLLNGRERYFHDDIHLNENGCRELGRLVAKQIQVAASDHVDADRMGTNPQSSRDEE